MAAFLVLPILILTITSFSPSEYLEFPPGLLAPPLPEVPDERGVWIEATLRSFRVALVVTVVAMTLGTLAAFPLVRRRFPGKQLLNSFLISPMILPVIVTSLAVYYVFASLRLIGTDVGLVLAHTVLALPFVVVIVSATLKGFDQSLERASLSLGASPVRTFFRVTLPITRAGLISAAIFAFLASFGDETILCFHASDCVAVPRTDA